MVNTIQIEHAVHNNRIKLFMKFPYDTQTIELARTMNGVKWSHTHKAWYLGYHPEVISQVNRTFVPKGIQLNLVNTLDDVERPKLADIKKKQQMHSYWKFQRN